MSYIIIQCDMDRLIMPGVHLARTQRTNEYQAICSTVPTIKCNKTERRCGVWCVQYLRYLIVALYFWCLHYCCHKFGISNWFKHSRPSIIVIYKIVDRLVLLWKNLNWMHHMYCLKKPRLASSITIEIRVYDCISVRSFF